MKQSWPQSPLKAIAKANGLSVAADLIEDSLGLTKTSSQGGAVIVVSTITR
jgi:hypothetical protein